MNMYKIIVSVFITWLSFTGANLFGQSSHLLDSLINDFQHGSKKQKIEAANELAWQLRYNHKDSALNYAQWAYNAGKELGDEEVKFTALKRMGVVLKNKGNFQQALEKLKEAISILKLLNDEKGMAAVYNNMGTIYRDMGAIDKAYVYYISSLEIKEKYYPDSRTLCNTYRNLGNFYNAHRTNFDTAAYYFNEAEKIAKALGEKGILANIESDRGSLYRTKKDYQKAREHLLRAISGYKEVDNVQGEALSLLTLGDVSTKLKDFNNARVYLFECLNTWQEMNDSIGIARANLNLGHLMFQQNKYETAIKYYDTSIAITKALNQPILTNRAFLGLSENYEGLKYYEKAYENFKAYHAIRDTLYNEDKNKAISLMREKFNTEKKEQEIEYLNTIQKQQAEALKQSRKLWISTMAISVLILFILGLAAVYYRDRQRSERREALRKDELHSLKLSALKQQKELQVMEAAFMGQEEERQRISSMLHGEVGSVLHTFKMYFSSWEEKMEGEREQYAKASELLDRATEEIREVSHTLDAGVVNNLGLSMALEEMANGINRSGKLAVTLDMHGIENNGLSSRKETGIYRIIQEAVGNIIRHAGASKMDISLTKNDDELTIIIEDNGKGFDIAQARKNGGLGLRNIEERAAQLGGNAVFDAMLGRGVTVIINIKV